MTVSVHNHRCDCETDQDNTIALLIEPPPSPRRRGRFAVAVVGWAIALCLGLTACGSVAASGDTGQMPGPPTFTYHQRASGQWNISTLSTPAYPAGVDPRYEIQLLGGKTPVHQLSDLLSDSAPANTHLLWDWNAPGHTISFGASQLPFGNALSEKRINWAALRIRTIDANEGYRPSDWEYIAAVYGDQLQPGS